MSPWGVLVSRVVRLLLHEAYSPWSSCPRLTVLGSDDLRLREAELGRGSNFPPSSKPGLSIDISCQVVVNA